MRMGENSREIGNIGEDMAVKYLENQGYQIIRRNFTTKYGEIDIIAQKGDVVAIVEVKMSQKVTDFLPSARVTKSKQQKIRKTANAFTWEYGLDWFYRYDVIEIMADEIFHIEDAFI